MSEQSQNATSQKAIDQQLVARVKAGDKQAFDVLVRKYQHKVLGLISRFIKDSDEIQDVAQEAFIKAYRAINKFRGDSAFYTWLYRIAVNTAKNHLVAQGRRPSGDGMELEDAEIFEGDILHEVATPEANIARDQLKATIDDALGKLPDDLRTAVTLREFDGLSYEEIAQEMGCPVGTVRSRIFRAREAIEQRIRPLLDGENVRAAG